MDLVIVPLFAEIFPSHEGRDTEGELCKHTAYFKDESKLM